MSTFYAPTSELYHYGRLGMKWGEHRFAKDASKQLKANAKKSARLWGAAGDYLQSYEFAKNKQYKVEKKRAAGGSERRIARLDKKSDKLQDKLLSSKSRAADLYDKYVKSVEEGKKLSDKIMSTPGFKDKYVTSIGRGSVTRDPYAKDARAYKKETGKTPFRKSYGGAVRTVEYDYKKVRRNTKLNRALARGRQYERGYRRVNTTYVVV